jgi:hypothetical protein
VKLYGLRRDVFKAQAVDLCFSFSGDIAFDNLPSMGCVAPLFERGCHPVHGLSELESGRRLCLRVLSLHPQALSQISHQQQYRPDNDYRHQYGGPPNQ